MKKFLFTMLLLMLAMGCTCAMAEECAHTGGEATCISLAVCDICGDMYGDVDLTSGGHAYLLTENIPGTCYTPGKKTYVCQHEGCPDPVKETVIPAYGQHLYHHWDILGGNQHHTACTLCGGDVDVSCTLWELHEVETCLSVCPVCGDFGETPFEVLIARDDAAVPIGTLLVRGLKEPVDGALFGFTVAGVYGGSLMEIRRPVSIAIPVECENFQVVRVELIDGSEVRTEIPGKLQGGVLKLEIDQAGLFLLVPAE